MSPPQQEGGAAEEAAAKESSPRTRKTVVLSVAGASDKAEDRKEKDEVNERLLRKEEKDLSANSEKKAATKKQKKENSHTTPQFPPPSSSVVVAHHRSAHDAVDAASRFILAKRIGVRPIPRRTPTPPLPFADATTAGAEPSSSFILSSKQKKKKNDKKTGLAAGGGSPPPLPLPAEALLFPPRDPQERKFRGNSCNAAEAEKSEMQRLLLQLAREREREEAAEAEAEEGRRSSSTCSGQQQRQRQRHRRAAVARAQQNQNKQNKQQKAAAAAVTTTAAVPEAFDLFRHEEYEHMCAPIVMDTSLPDYYTNSYACCWPAAPSPPSPSSRNNNAVNHATDDDDDHVGEAAVAEDEMGAVPSRFVAPGGVPTNSLRISGGNNEAEKSRHSQPPLHFGGYVERGSPIAAAERMSEIEEEGKTADEEEGEEDLLAVLAKAMAYSAALEEEVSRGFAFVATGDDADAVSVTDPSVTAAVVEGPTSPADSVTAVAGGLQGRCGENEEKKKVAVAKGTFEKHIHFKFTNDSAAKEEGNAAGDRAEADEQAPAGPSTTTTTIIGNSSCAGDRDVDVERSLRLRSLLAEQHPPAPQKVCARALTSEAARWANGWAGLGASTGAAVTSSSAPSSRPFTPMPPPPSSLQPPSSSPPSCVPPPSSSPPKIIIPLLAVMPTQQQQNLVSPFPIVDRRRQQQQLQCAAAASALVPVVGCQGGGGGGGPSSGMGMMPPYASAWPTPIPSPPPQQVATPPPPHHPHTTEEARNIEGCVSGEGMGGGGGNRQKIRSAAKAVAAEEREWRQAYRRWRRRRERRHRRLIASLFLGNSGGGEPLLKWYSQHPAQAAEAKAVIAAASYSHLFPSSQPPSQEGDAVGIGGGGVSAAQPSPPLLVHVLPLTRTAALTPLSFLYPALVPSAPNVPLPLPCAQSAPPPLSIDFSSLAASSPAPVSSSVGENAPSSNGQQPPTLKRQQHQQQQQVVLRARKINETDGEPPNDAVVSVSAVGVCPFWTHSFGAQKRFHAALGLCVAQRNAAAALRRLLPLPRPQQSSSNAPREEGNREPLPLVVNSKSSIISSLFSASHSLSSSSAHFDSYYSYHNTSPMGDPFADLMRPFRGRAERGGGGGSLGIDSISVQTRAQCGGFAEEEERRAALAANPLHDRFFAAHPPLRLPSSTTNSSGSNSSDPLPPHLLLPAAPLPPPPLLNGAVNILCPRRNLLFVSPLTLWHSGGDTATPATAVTAQNTATSVVLGSQHGQTHRHDVPSAAATQVLCSSPPPPPLAPSFTRSYLSAAAAAAATALPAHSSTDSFFSTIADANAHRPLGALAHYRRKAFDRSPSDCGAAGVLDMLRDLMEEADQEEEEGKGRKRMMSVTNQTPNSCYWLGGDIPYLRLSVAVSSREGKPIAAIASNNGGKDEPPTLRIAAEDENKEGEEEACSEDVPSAIATGDIATAGAPKQEGTGDTATAATSSSSPPPPLASFFSLLAELRAVCLDPLIPNPRSCAAAATATSLGDGRSRTNRCAQSVPTPEAPMVDSTHELALLRDLSYLHFRSPPFAYPPALLPAPPPSSPASSTVASSSELASHPFPPRRPSSPIPSPSPSNPLLYVLADTLPLLGGDVLPDIGPMAVEGLPLWGTGVVFVEAPRVRRVFFGNGNGGAKTHNSKGFEAAEAKALRRLRKERAEQEKKVKKEAAKRLHQDDEEEEHSALKSGGDTLTGVRNPKEGGKGYDDSSGDANVAVVGDVCSCTALCPSAKECAAFAAVSAKKRVFGPTAAATYRRPITTAGAQRCEPSDDDERGEGANEDGTKPEERTKKTKRKEEEKGGRTKEAERRAMMEDEEKEEREKKALFASAHRAALREEASARATAVRAEAAVAWAWQRQWLRFATGAAASSSSSSCVANTVQKNHQQQQQQQELNQKRRAVGDDGAFAAASSPLSAALLAGMTSPNFLSAACPKPRAAESQKMMEAAESSSFLEYLLLTDTDSCKGSSKSRNIPRQQQQLQPPRAPLSLPSVLISEADECVVVDLFSTLWRPSDILKMRAEVLVLEQDLIACLVAAAVLMQTPPSSSSSSSFTSSEPSSAPKSSCLHLRCCSLSPPPPTLPSVDEEARLVGITMREAFAAEEEKLRIKNSEKRRKAKGGGGCCAGGSGGDNSPFSSTVTGDGRDDSGGGFCCCNSSSAAATKEERRMAKKAVNKMGPSPNSDGEDARSPDYLLPLTPSPPLLPSAPPFSQQNKNREEQHHRSQQSDTRQFLNPIVHLFAACPAAAASCASSQKETKSAPQTIAEKKKKKGGGATSRSSPSPSLLLAVNHLFHQKRLQRCADLRQQLANAAKYCREDSVAAALQQKSDSDVLSEALLLFSPPLAAASEVAVGTCRRAHSSDNDVCNTVCGGPPRTANAAASAVGALPLVASLYGPLVRSALAEAYVAVGVVGTAVSGGGGGCSSGHCTSLSFLENHPLLVADAFVHDVLSDAVACAEGLSNSNAMAKAAKEKEKEGKRQQTRGATTAYPADVKKNKKQRDKANAKRRAAKQRPEPDQFIRLKLRNASVEMMPSRFYFFPHKTVEEAQQHAAFLATEREREKAMEEMKEEEERRERAGREKEEEEALRQMNKNEGGETRKCTFARGSENPHPALVQPQSHPRTHHRRSVSASSLLRHPFSGSLPTPSASVVNAALASITSAAASAPLSHQPQFNSGLNSPTAAAAAAPTPSGAAVTPLSVPRNRRQRSLSPLGALSVSASVGGRFHRSLSLGDHFHFHSDRTSEPHRPAGGGGGESGAAVDDEVARGSDAEIGGLLDPTASSVSVVGPLALISAALHDGVRRGGGGDDGSLILPPPTTAAKSPSRASAGGPIGSAQRSPSKMVASERRHRRGRSGSIGISQIRWHGGGSR